MTPTGDSAEWLGQMRSTTPTMASSPKATHMPPTTRPMVRAHALEKRGHLVYGSNRPKRTALLASLARIILGVGTITATPAMMATTPTTAFTHPDSASPLRDQQVRHLREVVVLRVAWTLADLAGRTVPGADEVAEALGMRLQRVAA